MADLEQMYKALEAADAAATAGDASAAEDAKAIAQMIQEAQATPAADPNSPQAQMAAQSALATQNPAEAVAGEDYRQFQALDGGVTSFQSQLASPGKAMVAANDILSTAGRAIPALVGGLTGWATRGKGYTPEEMVAGAKSAVTGSNYDDELQQQKLLLQKTRNRSGWAGTAAEAAPLMALPVPGGAAAKVFGNALVGGGMAAGEGEDPLLGAAAGVLGGAGGEVVGKVISKGLGKLLPKAPLVAQPTSADFLRKGGAALKEAGDKHGLHVAPEGIQSIGQKAVAFLKDPDVAFDPTTDTAVKTVVDKLAAMYNEGGPISINRIRKLRTQIYKLKSRGPDADLAQNRMLSRLRTIIDEHVTSGQHLVGDNVDAGLAAYKRGLGDYAQGKKLERIENLITSGDLTKNASPDTKIRTLIDPTHSNSSRARLTKDEAAYAERIVKPGRAQRASKVIGEKLTPGGTAALVEAIVAFKTGGLSVPISVGKALVGTGLKMNAERLAKKSVDEFVRLVATGSAEKRVAQNALQRMSKAKSDAIAAMVARGAAAAGPAALVPQIQAQ